MFKGLLTMAITVAVSATAFGRGEVRTEVGRDGRVERQDARGAEGKAAVNSALTAKLLEVARRADAGNKVAEFVIKFPEVAARLIKSEAALTTLMNAKNQTLTSLWINFALPYAKANETAMVEAVSGVLAEGAQAGMDKVGAATNKLMELKDSAVALKNLGLLMTARGILMAQKVSTDLTAKAIDYIRNGSVATKASKEAKELGDQIDGLACLPRGA